MLPSSGSLDLRDRGAFAAFCAQTLQREGVEAGRGILYALALARGWADGYKVRLGFDGAAPPVPRMRDPGMPLLFWPETTDLRTRFRGVLERSPEAELQLARADGCEQPVCVIGAGYAAGWFSAVLAERVLVRETSCRARGDAACRFDARRLSDWEAEPDAEIEQLRAFLDLDEIEARGRKPACARCRGAGGAGGIRRGGQTVGPRCLPPHWPG